MAAPVSSTSGYATGIQSAKGTAATAFYYHRLMASGGEATFTQINPQGEHYGGTSPRPTGLKTVGKRSSVMVPVMEQGLLYPGSLGYILRLLGWDVSTDATDAPNFYVHTFTIGDRKDHVWGSAIIDVEDDVESGKGYRFKRLLRDLRYQSLQIQAGAQSIGMQASGAALDEIEIAGTETFSTEGTTFFDPAGGSFTCTYGGTGLFSQYSGVQIMISNPLRMNDFRMHSFGIGSMDSLGSAGVGMIFSGVDLHEDVYRSLKWGDTSTGPDIDIPEVIPSVTLESYENITGTAQPYSLTVSIAKATGAFQTPPSRGTALMRGAVSCVMVDEATGTEPVTIELINTVASYG